MKEVSCKVTGVSGLLLFYDFSYTQTPFYAFELCVCRKCWTCMFCKSCWLSHSAHIKTTLESERSTISFFILLAISEEAVISKILRISLTVSFTENFSQPPKQFGLWCKCRIALRYVTFNKTSPVTPCCNHIIMSLLLLHAHFYTTGWLLSG